MEILRPGTDRVRTRILKCDSCGCIWKMTEQEYNSTFFVKCPHCKKHAQYNKEFEENYRRWLT